METSLRVAVTAIVVLVVALVVLMIFTGGVEKVMAFINSIFGDPCKTACDSYQLTCAAGESKPYNQLPGCTSDAAGTCTCKRTAVTT